MKRFVKICFWFVFTVSLVFAQEQWTLQQCLKRALKGSHLLKAARYEEQKADVQLRASRAMRWPVVNMSSGYTRVGNLSTIEFSTGPNSPPRKFTFGTPNRMNLNFQLQMPLFTWWRIENTIGLAKVGQNLSALQTEKQKIELTAQVLQAFYGALLSKKLLKLARQDLERTQKYLKITERRFQAGQLPRLELLKAQVEQKRGKTRVSTAEGEYQKSLLFLAKVTNASSTIPEPAGQLRFTPVSFEESALLEQAYRQRVELQQLEIQKQMLEKQQNIARAGNKPNLVLVSSYSVLNGFNPMDPEKFYTNYNIGVQFNWPLFDAFSTHYQMQEQQLDRQAVEEREKEIQSLIQMQVRQALIALKQAEEKIKTQEQNIGLAREALEIAQNQYDHGLISSLQLLDAQKLLLNTETAYWQTIFSHILAQIELGKAIGSFPWFEDQLLMGEKQ